MRKRIKVVVTIVILSGILIWTVIQKGKGGQVTGIIVSRTESTFTVQTENGLVVGSFPDGYDYSALENGDEVIVYFKGEILESSPARIKDVNKLVIK